MVGCGDGSRPTDHDIGTDVAPAKMAGVNLEVRRRLTDADLDELVDAGVAWIAVIPFGWQPRWDVPEVRLRATGVRWGETDDGLRETIRRARERGIRSLLKPHVWLTEEVAGQWRGTIGFEAEADWLAWESDYRLLVLHYAALAQEAGADMFSVGVELHRSVRDRPAFWQALIADTRRVYSGPMTYGANWDREALDVTFWDDLDFIGVHAYFPLTHRLDASVAQLERGWQQPLQQLASLCERHDRQVLFTEIGYRSIEGAGVEPWNFTVQGAVDTQEQADAYEALFRALWHREWFAGLFLWEWVTGDDDGADGDYSPQHKPAETVMSSWFVGD
jgi:hypothetical protein